MPMALASTGQLLLTVMSCIEATSSTNSAATGWRAMRHSVWHIGPSTSDNTRQSCATWGRLKGRHEASWLHAAAPWHAHIASMAWAPGAH